MVDDFVFFALLNTWRLQRLGALNSTKVVHQHQGWRLISCIWLHAGVIHLLANMLSLIFIGVRLEQHFGFGKTYIPRNWPTTKHIFMQLILNFFFFMFSSHWLHLSTIRIRRERTVFLIHTEQNLCRCFWCTIRASWSHAFRANYKLVYIHKQGKWSF